MGTFGTYEGSMEIPEDKRDEFNQNVLKLLHYGGMMTFSTVYLYGQKIPVIAPIPLDTKEAVHFHYNYFEDDAWETATFYTDRSALNTAKIGNSEFNAVVMAVYYLYDMYNDNMGYVNMNGGLDDMIPYFGWINYLTGLKYTMEKDYHLWDFLEYYILSQGEYRNCQSSYTEILNHFIPSIYHGADGRELVEILLVCKGVSFLDDVHDEKSGRYPGCLWMCMKAVSNAYHYNTADDIIGLLHLPYSEREAAAEYYTSVWMRELAQYSLEIPAYVILYMLTSCTNADDLDEAFWKRWEKERDLVYADYVRPIYAPEKLQKTRISRRIEPIEPVRTTDFLEIDENDCWSQEEWVKSRDLPAYVLSDDDRAIWWDGSDDVQFSKDMHQWMYDDLAIRYRKLLEQDNLGQVDMRYLINCLKEADETYKRIFAFKDNFEEFTAHIEDRKYKALIMLLKLLIDENKDYAVYTENISTWGLKTRKFTFNRGRIKIKRYLAIIANKQLRMKVFGF